LSAQDTNPLLAPLRPDLELFPGPPDVDGAPSYSLLDPVTGTYHKVGWAESVVLQYLHRPIHLDALTETINTRSTLNLSSQDILALVQDLTSSGLVTSACIRDVGGLMAEQEKKKVHPLKWLLHHYLYFRIPFFYPEGFLQRTVPWVRKLGGRFALTCYFLAALFGLYFVASKPETYFSTLMDFLAWDKAIYYALTVALIKAIHEFSHAYTAAAQGVRVRSMGIAFMIFWPIPFCDITDGWRLKAKRARARIGIAGIGAEAAVAAFSLFLWGITPDGIAHSLFFMLSSASLLSTILVNLNPAMRFDGYYILSDLWGIENLQIRAFAMAKWKLRKMLLGLDDPVPETGVPSLRLVGMMAYSIYTWIYRVGLYLGIALIVYYKFTKVVGGFLFAIEILMFLLLPILKEAQFLMSARARLSLNLRLIASALILTGTLTWLGWPMPRSQSIPAVVTPVQSQIIYAPSGGRIEHLLTVDGRPLQRGDQLEKGTALLSIRSEARDTQIAVLVLEEKRIQDEIRILGDKEESRALLPQRREELVRTQAQLEELRQGERINHLSVAMSGTLSHWDRALRDGHYIQAKAVLGRIDNPGQVQLTAFVPENALGKIDDQAPLYFIPADMPRKIPFTRTRTGTVPEKTLDFPALASIHGGELSVLPKEGGLELQESLYRIDGTLETGGTPPRLGQTGTLWTTTQPRSLLADAYRQVRRVLLRESNF
jgi:putative peptide zinc metalloprotease protein